MVLPGERRGPGAISHAKTLLAKMNYTKDLESEQLAKALQESEEIATFHALSSNELTDEEIAKLLQHQEEFAKSTPSIVDLTSPEVKPTSNGYVQADEIIAKALQMEETENQRKRYRSPPHIHPPLNWYNRHRTQPLQSRRLSFESPDYEEFETEENSEMYHQDRMDPDNMSYEQLLALEEKMGKVEKGLSTIELSTFPVHFYKKESTKGDTTCQICQSEYEDKDKLRYLPCFHSFHMDCIDKWLQKKLTCPVCLKEVKSKS